MSRRVSALSAHMVISPLATSCTEMMRKCEATSPVVRRVAVQIVQELGEERFVEARLSQ
jgi:hypothetical protein